MPKLITRCLSEDYQTVTDNHDDNDRGELDIPALTEALHSASYIMPHSSDPNSPHRPAVAVIVSGEIRPTVFYVSDYQGSFSLEPSDNGVFDAENIVDLVLGRTTIEEIKASKVASDRSMSRGIYIVLGSILLTVLYFAAAPIFGW